MSDLWWIMIALGIAGLMGGLINALNTDNGFVLPKSSEVEGAKILRIGALGNMFIGGVAALVSWGLYGPLADSVIIGTRPADATEPTLAISTLFTGVLIGVGGARWLTNEVDKKLLKAAAAEAAGAQQNSGAAAAIAGASPASALEIAKALP